MTRRVRKSPLKAGAVLIYVCIAEVIRIDGVPERRGSVAQRRQAERVDDEMFLFNKYYYLRHKQGTKEGKGSAILELSPRGPARNATDFSCKHGEGNVDWQMERKEGVGCEVVRRLVPLRSAKLSASCKSSIHPVGLPSDVTVNCLPCLPCYFALTQHRIVAIETRSARDSRLLDLSLMLHETTCLYFILCLLPNLPVVGTAAFILPTLEQEPLCLELHVHLILLSVDSLHTLR